MSSSFSTPPACDFVSDILLKNSIPEKSCAILEVLNDLLVQAKITQPVGIIEGAADRILEKKPWEVFLKINASHLIILLIGVMVTWLLLKNGH